jgi:TolB protein
MCRHSFLRIAFFLLGIGVATSTQAELTVDITKGTQGAMPIAIVPFAQAGYRGEAFADIIASDLAQSGQFSPLAQAQMPERPTPPATVNFPLWQTAGQEHVVIGRVITGASGGYEAEFVLFDAIRGQQIFAEKIPFKPSEGRHTAHRIADLIYKQLTGDRGIFNTRVAFISASGAGKNREYRLEIADTDGQDAKTIISSPEPIMSPAWSPDGKRMAYVSFEEGTSAIFVQDLGTGERQKVSDAAGINGAPAWSPDGRELALTLSKDGSPDIYLLNVVSHSLTRLTRDNSIETEPNWSPDGRKLVFTSDRGGKPQLYLVSSAGGEPERLTFEGDYNARGVFSPDGKAVAMVHGGNGYRIALMDIGSRHLRVLSRGRQDESPGFSPDGKWVLYISRNGGGDQLMAVSLDGKTSHPLDVRAGNVRGAAWSP